MAPLDLIGDGEIVVALDRSLNVVDACSLNHPEQRLLGCEQQDLVGLNWRDLLHADDLELFQDLLQQLLQQSPGSRRRANLRLSVLGSEPTCCVIDMGLLDYSLLGNAPLLVAPSVADLFAEKSVLLLWVEVWRPEIASAQRVEIAPGVTLSPRLDPHQDFTLSLLEKMGCLVLVIAQDYLIEYANAHLRRLAGDVVGSKCYQCMGLEAPCRDCRISALYADADDSLTYQTSVCLHYFRVLASPLRYPCGRRAALLVMTELTDPVLPRQSASLDR